MREIHGVSTFPRVRISISSSTFRRTAASVNARRYAIAGGCLLVVAIALRFYYLTEHALRYDEVAAALNSRYSLSQVVGYTRVGKLLANTLASWAVQKVEISHPSVWYTLAAAFGGLLLQKRL